MSPTSRTPAPPPTKNDDFVTEQYVDGPVGVNFVNGNMHMEFYTLRTDNTQAPPAQYRKVTMRMVIPLAGAVEVQGAIGSILNALQKQGVVKPILHGTETQQ